MQRALLAVGVLMVSVAAACGGGSGGTAPATKPPVSPAVHATAGISQSSGPSWLETTGADIPPGDPEYVVDWRNRGVWALDPGGAGRARILAWTPDGKAVVAANGELYVARPLEDFVRFLPAYPAAKEAVSFSPDGKLVALHVIKPLGSSQLEVIDVTTEQVVKTFDDPKLEASRWSSDSLYLTLTGANSGTFVWDRHEDSVKKSDGADGAPSHDGKRLAYAKTDDPENHGEKRFQIVTRDPNGGNEVVVATVDAVTADVFSWSPDDQFIAVGVSSTHVEGEFTVGTQDVRIIATTRPFKQMLVHGAWPEAWLPGGDSLLVTGNVCSTFDLMSINAASGALRNYTSSTDWDLYPYLSADGKRVAFTTYDLNGGSAIRLLDLATGGVRAVLSGSGISLWRVPSDVVWSPDGRFLTIGFDAGHGGCEAEMPQTTTVEAVP